MCLCARVSYQLCANVCELAGNQMQVYPELFIPSIKKKQHEKMVNLCDIWRGRITVASKEYETFLHLHNEEWMTDKTGPRFTNKYT